MPGRTTAGKRYAEAIANIARADGSWDRWRGDLDAVAQALHGDAELRVRLESPSIHPEHKSGLLQAALGGRISPGTMSLLTMMARRGRLNLLSDVATWFDELADRAQGVVRVTVTSAQPLTDDERDRLRQRLGGADGHVLLTERVDPALIGGLVVRHEDIIRDFSLRTRLQTLRERLN